MLRRLLRRLRVRKLSPKALAIESEETQRTQPSYPSCMAS